MVTFVVLQRVERVGQRQLRYLFKKYNHLLRAYFLTDPCEIFTIYWNITMLFSFVYFKRLLHVK